MSQDTTPIEGVIRATWTSIGASLALVALGLVAALVPLAVSIAVSILIVWVVMFSGLAHLVHAWDVRGSGLFRWRLLVGLVYVGGAQYLVWQPIYGLGALTFFIGWMFAIEAVLQLGGAWWMRRHRGSGWLAADAALTLLLAACIMVMWPWSRPWMLCLLVGLNILGSGLAYLALLRDNGLRLRAAA